MDVRVPGFGKTFSLEFLDPSKSNVGMYSSSSCSGLPGDGDGVSDRLLEGKEPMDLKGIACELTLISLGTDLCSLSPGISFQETNVTISVADVVCAGG